MPNVSLKIAFTFFTIVNHNQTLLTLFTIVYKHQQKVETVRIGDRLTFRIEIPEKTPYGIFARCEDNKRGKDLILQKLEKKNTHCRTCPGTAWQWPRTRDQRSQSSMRTDVPSTQPSSQGIERYNDPNEIT